MPSKMKPCEDYRTALTDAAAAAVEPSLELRSHLNACESCRAVFSEEAQLFAAIDSSVCAAANAEVPASFFPRVRASLEDASPSQRGWTPFLIFAAASAAIVLTVFIAARPRHAVNDDQAKQSIGDRSLEKTTRPAGGEAAGSPATVAANGSCRTQQRGNSVSRNSVAPSPLEVLVPPEEREAFARYIGARQERSDVGVAVALLAPASDKKDELLSVEALQIAKLEVRALESLAGEVPDGTEEEQ